MNIETEFKGQTIILKFSAWATYQSGKLTQSIVLQRFCIANKKWILIFTGSSCDQEDIVFLVDSSGSIYDYNWPTVKEFMKNIVRDYTIGSNNVRVGVTIFADNVQSIFQLNTYSTQYEILNAIDNIPFLGTSTNTPEAIRYMRTTMFTPQNGDRSSAPNVAIIITDGVPRVPNDVNEARRLTLQEANLARRQGINMFTIGIGPELTTEFLAQIADQPTNTHVFQVNQVRELENILNQVSAATCNTPPPVPSKSWIIYLLVFNLNPLFSRKLRNLASQ